MAHPMFQPKRTSFAKAPDFSAKRDTEAVLKGEKKTPTEVDYRAAAVDSKERCHECKFYGKPGDAESSCAKVVGVVRAEGTCDLFAKSPSATVSPEAKQSTEIVIRIG